MRNVTSHQLDLDRMRDGYQNLFHSGKLDFSAAYVAIGAFRDLILAAPGIVGEEIVTTLKQLLEDPEYRRQTQSVFFYEEVSRTLTLILSNGYPRAYSPPAHRSLQHILCSCSGPSLQATADEVSRLPLAVPRPEINDDLPNNDVLHGHNSPLYQLRNSPHGTILPEGTTGMKHAGRQQPIQRENISRNGQQFFAAPMAAR